MKVTTRLLMRLGIGFSPKNEDKNNTIFHINEFLLFTLKSFMYVISDGIGTFAASVLLPGFKLHILLEDVWLDVKRLVLAYVQ